MSLLLTTVAAKRRLGYRQAKTLHRKRLAGVLVAVEYGKQPNGRIIWRWDAESVEALRRYRYRNGFTAKAWSKKWPKKKVEA